jgi:hypothetical protein
VAFTVCCWLLCLYPRDYREEFGAEMTSVFRDARSALPPGLAVKISFYVRESCGLLSGALRAHFDRLFGPAASSGRFDMRALARFRRSTVFLMLVMFAGVVLAMAAAISVAGGTLRAVWPTLAAVLAFLLLSMCAAAAVVLGVLRTLRRIGVHRLEEVRVESNADRQRGYFL